jgi:4-hydroxymandelate oxidase
MTTNVPDIPDLPGTVAELEALAEARVDKLAWDYIAHGSGDELTMRDNVAAWQRRRLRPHVLQDMSDVQTSTTVLGSHISAPVFIAPTAMHRFYCDEAEAATARAAARAGPVMVVSMAATTSLEDVARAAPGGAHWAQMYMLRDRGLTRSLAERARDAGYGAIMVSVDGAAIPRRSRLAGGALTPPPSFRFPNLAPPGTDDSNLMAMVDFDPSLTVEDLALFHEWSGLPIAAKGVMRGDDAAACVDAGVSAIAVSNHGGRTLDGTVATADALTDVVEGVAGRAEVYVDGGIRNGTDIVKALALGARSVMVGRPVLWGLAVGGEDGAAGVLGVLGDEVRRAMALCGADRVDGVTPDFVAR